MTFTTIEILALILIVVGLIKIFVLAIDPKAWMNFAKSIWNKPKLTQAICFLLAALVCYHLINNGMTIVQILSVALFITLFMAVALAPEVDDLIKKYQARIKRGNLWKQYWLYTLVWLVLLLWGLREIFMK